MRKIGFYSLIGVTLLLAVFLAFNIPKIFADMGDQFATDSWRITSGGDLVPATTGVYDIGSSSLYPAEICLGGVCKSSWGSVVSPMTDATGYVNPTDAGNYLRLYDAGYIRLGDATNAGDYYILYTGDTDAWYAGQYDTSNDFLIGYGSTIGTDARISIVDSAVETRVVIGDGVDVEDKVIVIDGSAYDFYIAYDDSADDLLIGLGAVVGTTPAISITDGLAITTYGDITMTGTTPLLTIGDAGEEDTTILFDGNAKDFYIALYDTTDDLLIGLGNAVGTTPAISIDEGLAITTYADITMTGTTPTLTVGDGGNEDNSIVFSGVPDFTIGVDATAGIFEITNGLDLDQTTAFSIADTTLAAIFYGDVSVVGTTPLLTIGDGGNEDAGITFNGQSTADFYIATDNNDDSLIIGFGSTIGTDSRITIQDNGTETRIELGDAVTAEDTVLVFDGNAYDFYIALDDSADDLIIGLGAVVATTPIISMDENLAITTYGDITMTGVTPLLTIGDGGDEDTGIVFDSDTVDYYIASENALDALLIGKGSAIGTTPAIAIDTNQDVHLYQDLVIDKTINYAADVQTSDTYVITLQVAPAAYTTGMPIYFKANTSNTNACSLNVNGLGAKALKSLRDQDPGNNSIEAGSIVHCIYDGTNFQILNPAAN